MKSTVAFLSPQKNQEKIRLWTDRNLTCFLTSFPFYPNVKSSLGMRLIIYHYHLPQQEPLIQHVNMIQDNTFQPMNNVNFASNYSIVTIPYTYLLYNNS